MDTHSQSRGPSPLGGRGVRGDPGLPSTPTQAETEPGCVRGIWPGWQWGWILVVMIIELTVIMANCWDPVPSPWKEGQAKVEQETP